MIKNAEAIRLEQSVMEELRLLRLVVDGLVKDIGGLSARLHRIEGEFTQHENKVDQMLTAVTETFSERIDRMDTDLTELENKLDDAEWNNG